MMPGLVKPIHWLKVSTTRMQNGDCDEIKAKVITDKLQPQATGSTIQYWFSTRRVIN